MENRVAKLYPELAQPDVSDSDGADRPSRRPAGSNLQRGTRGPWETRARPLRFLNMHPLTGAGTILCAFWMHEGRTGVAANFDPWRAQRHEHVRRLPSHSL